MQQLSHVQIRMDVSLSFYVILIQQASLPQVHAVQTCYYRNGSNIVAISCKGDCCMGLPTSADGACCPRTSMRAYTIPIIITVGVCILAVCLSYLRPLLKICFCGCKCPCRNRFQVRSSDPAVVNAALAHGMYNVDLPDYEATMKGAPGKDMTPPPYNFVTTHPSDFGIETQVPSAPPQYRPRSDSMIHLESPTPVQS